MAYTKTNWVDRVIDGSGSVIVAGTPVNATNMNKIENEIEDLDTKTSVLNGSTNPISDCNTITETGVYKVIAQTLNAPTSNSHYVIYHVLYTTGEMTQIAINTPNAIAYTRTFYNGSWTSWKKIVYQSEIVNNLTSTETNVPLSAAQGKALQDNKVNKSDIVNNLYSTETNVPLSAAQGKALQDNKVDRSEIVNNLNSTLINVPLSAAQGKALNDSIPKIEYINVQTDETGRFVMNKPMDKLIALHIYSSSCYTILRYLNSTSTMVYVRDINSSSAVANTELTGNIVYFN